MSDEEKPILTWDTTELVDNHVKDIQDTLGEPEHPCLAKTEEEIRQEVCEDQVFFEVEWEDLLDRLTEIMEKCNPNNLDWIATVNGFGWRGQYGHKPPFDAPDGKTLLQEILPRADNTFWIYEHEVDGKKGLKINNCHHDSPIRGKEWYYIMPHKEKDDE